MKKIIFLLVTAISFIIITNFLSSIYILWHKKDLLIIAKKQLQREEESNQKLKGELTRVKSQDFVEEQARDKLFMVKPGENDIVIPPAAVHTIAPIKKDTQKFERPYWQEWITIFFP